MRLSELVDIFSEPIILKQEEEKKVLPENQAPKGNREYVNSQEEVPQGTQVYTGTRGRLFYIANPGGQQEQAQSSQQVQAQPQDNKPEILQDHNKLFEENPEQLASTNKEKFEQYMEDRNYSSGSSASAKPYDTSQHEKRQAGRPYFQREPHIADIREGVYDWEKQKQAFALKAARSGKESDKKTLSRMKSSINLAQSFGESDLNYEERKKHQFEDVIALWGENGELDGVGNILEFGAGTEDKHAYLGAISVAPKHLYENPGWKKGTGSRLMTHLFKYARNRGLDRLELSALDDAVPFYEHAGFKKVMTESMGNHYNIDGAGMDKFIQEHDKNLEKAEKSWINRLHELELEGFGVEPYKEVAKGTDKKKEQQGVLVPKEETELVLSRRIKHETREGREPTITDLRPTMYNLSKEASLEWIGKLREKDMIEYDPEKYPDPQLKQDQKLLTAYYETIRRGGTVKNDGKDISVYDVKYTYKKIIKELIKREKTEFDPESMKPLEQELFVEAAHLLKEEGIEVPLKKTAFQKEDFGRSRFDVKEGDTGTFIIQEHLRGISEEGIQAFKGISSYKQWESAKRKLTNKGEKVSAHSDIRMSFGGSEFIGFTLTSPANIEEESRVLNPGRPILVAGFKNKGSTDWMKAGEGKVKILGPTEVMFLVGSGKVEVTYVKESGHAIEFTFSDVEKIPNGIWQLNYVPVSDGRKWMFSHVP